MPVIPVFFVVSTGRCGSTVLSNMFRMHPDILSLSEFFTSIGRVGLSEKEMTGTEFWDLLASPRYGDSRMLQAEQPRELLYPVGGEAEGRAFSLERGGIPPLSLVTLPHLTSAPDDLYFALRDRFVNVPSTRLTEHYAQLFAALGEGRRASVAVERSGGSLEFIEHLTTMFPRSGIIHLYRDGRDSALSMSRHPRYRFTLVRRLLSKRIGCDPYDVSEHAYREQADAFSRAAGDLADLLPHRITPEIFRCWHAPLSRFGSLWSTMTLTKVPLLRRHAPLLEISYEEMARDIRGALADMVDFLGLTPRNDWLDDASALFRPVGGKWRSEPEDVQAALERSCRPGMEYLYGSGD